MNSLAPARPPRRRLLAAAAALALAGALVLPVLRAAGGFLVKTDPPARSDAAVVLNHGMEIYLRIAEAARLYREGWVDKVVVNGGRRPPLVREWEAAGMKRDWKWSDEYAPVLEHLGVPRKKAVFPEVKSAWNTVREGNRGGK